MEWYERYGHLPFTHIPKVSQSQCNSIVQCEPCIKGKMTKPVLHSYGTRSTRVSELLQVDPYYWPTYRYMLVLVDDFSRFIITRAIRKKAEAASAL